MTTVTAPRSIGSRPEWTWRESSILALSGRGELPARAVSAGIRRFDEAVVDATFGDDAGRLRAVRVRTPLGVETIDADMLAISGGYEPALSLHLQRKGPTRYDEKLGAPVPASNLPGQWIAGAAGGLMALPDCLSDGARAAREALAEAGFDSPSWSIPRSSKIEEDPPALLWHVPAPDGDESRSFVDLFRDVTASGVARAVGAGIRHVEHVKRYTLIGTGVEQGRSARTNASALTATMTERPLADIGTTGSRPPLEPLSFHLIAGRAKGERFEPVRTTAIHAAHVALGAIFEPSGQWLRPNHYPRAGESMRDAVARECRAARTAVAMMDVSTLGKIDVRGKDAAWFLDQLYVNSIATIPVGKARYSLMCRLDGSVLDDGIVMRTGENRFFVTASTGHAAAVVDWMEEWLQTEWPQRRVFVTSVTEQFSTVALVGPRSRDVLAVLAPDLDASKEGFSFLSVRRSIVAGIPDAQVARVSFSGELAYEISVPWDLGETLWRLDIGGGTALRDHALWTRSAPGAPEREGLHHRRAGHRGDDDAAGRGPFLAGRENEGLRRKALVRPARPPSAGSAAARRFSPGGSERGASGGRVPRVPGLASPDGHPGSCEHEPLE